MKKPLLAFLTMVAMSGCATIDTNNIHTLVEQEGTGIQRSFNAPIDLVFKVAKSIVLHGPCAKGGVDIVSDEITGHIYSNQLGPYGMRTILWLIIVKPEAENRSNVEFIWSKQVLYSKGKNYDQEGTEYPDAKEICAGKNIFKDIDDYWERKRGLHWGGQGDAQKAPVKAGKE